MKHTPLQAISILQSILFSKWTFKFVGYHSWSNPTMASIPFSLPAPEITYGRWSRSSRTVPINSSQCCVGPKMKRLRFTTTHLRRREYPCKPLRVLQSTGPEYPNHLVDDKVPPSPLLELTQKFYSSLNGKDIKRLEKFIAPDCRIEDKAYYKPLKGKVTKSFLPRKSIFPYCLLEKGSPHFEEK